ncbi:MAG: F0F1 ATP synthase subunit delta [Hyphomicrobiaceae bacterium]|nr:F0F1 ATP synthase subunit delta [Hyphomicrobiaceae bacterium]
MAPCKIASFPRRNGAVTAPSSTRNALNPALTRAFDVATDDPMMASVAGRYAAALFDLAQENNQQADVESDLGKFQALLDMSDDLSRLVKSPLYSADEQGAAIEKVASAAGIGAITTNFLKLIARNRRLFAVDDMIRAYRTLAARGRDEVTAEVTSAVTLNDEQVAQLKETLKASVGKEVQLATRVDPSLLGGLIVKIGSRMVDSSLKTKLSNLRLALRGAG